jgi:hypothetical protein
MKGCLDETQMRDFVALELSLPTKPAEQQQQV